MSIATVPPHIQLAVLSRDYVLSRAIQVIAKLGIADEMSEEPLPIQTIAMRSSTLAEPLDRLLSFLTSYGLFNKTSEGYVLTPLSQPLRKDHPNSIRDLLCLVDESWWQAFSQLEATLKTGISAFEIQHGTDFFSYMNQHHEIKLNYEKGLYQLSQLDDKTIANCYDFGQHRTLVTMGYQTFHLSNAISKTNSSITIHNVDITLPVSPVQLKNQLEALQGMDAYLLKGILHDYSQETIRLLLNTIQSVMPIDSSLLIAEQVIPDHSLPHTNKTMDIIMMVLVGGRQCTAIQWQQIIEPGGLTLHKTHPSNGLFTILEFKKTR